MSRVTLLIFVAFVAVAQSPDELVQAGHFKRAKAVLEPRLAANPNDARASYLMSKVKASFGDENGALALAEKAVALDSKQPDYHAHLANLYGSQAEHASMLKQFGLARKAKREAEAALALDPNHFEALGFMMIYLMKAPAIIGGDKAKARTIPDQVAKSDASRGYLAHARLAREENQNDQLEGLYLKAIEANPKNFQARGEICNLYNSPAFKKYDVCEKHAREAIGIDPRRGGGYSLLVIALALQQKWPEVDAALQQAEKHVTDNLTPYYMAGRVALNDGADPKRAETYLRKYLSQEPEGNSPLHAYAHWSLGLALEKQGRKQDAVTALEASLRLKPDFEQGKKDLKRLK